MQQAWHEGEAVGLERFVTPALAGRLRHQLAEAGRSGWPVEPRPAARLSVRVILGGGRHDRRCTVRVTSAARGRPDDPDPPAEPGGRRETLPDVSFWRFVLDPARGWLVAAIDVPPPTAGRGGRLAEVDQEAWTYNAEPAALECNRRGVLSQRQRTALRRSGVQWAGLCLPGTALLVLALHLPSGKAASSLGAAGGMAVVVGLLYLWRRWAAARSGVVECIVGQISRYSRLGISQLTVRHRTLLVPASCPAVSGGRYRLYVAAKAWLVVAVEPAGDLPADDGAGQ